MNKHNFDQLPSFWAVSDLHLHPSRPDRIEAFRDFLQTASQHTSHVFVLGDLFDYWLGPESFHKDEYREALSVLEVADPGEFTIVFLPGNRDFPAGLDLGKKPGVVAPGETVSVERDSYRWLFLHGDVLCHHDTGYQCFRRLIQTPEVVDLFRGFPSPVKTGVIKFLRGHSSKKVQELDEDKSRLTPYLMRAYLYRNYHHMVCGHVHRPGRYRIHVDGELRNVWVLGDWYTSENSYFLKCEGGKVELSRWG